MERYTEISRVLWLVLLLNLGSAGAKILFGYLSGTVSILSDGFHSLADSASNIVGLVGVHVAQKPPDLDHPYGHRKFETLAAGGIFTFLVLAVIEVLRLALTRCWGSTPPPEISAASFAVMGGTLAINLWVVRYERRVGTELSSEVLLADAMHTRSDVLTSLAVVGSLAGIWAGYLWLDPVAALIVAVFIARTAVAIARDASRILADTVVIDVDHLRRIVLSVPAVVGCHQIRTRGSADHVFVDLHIWMPGDMRLDRAHGISHEVKDRLMANFPQVEDVIIHIEPAPDLGREKLRD